MKRKTVLWVVGSALLLFLVLSFSSCTIAKISGRGSIPLMLNNPPARVDVVSHLVEKKMVTFDYTSSFDVSEIIAEKLASADADAVINLTILIKTDFSTFCVNLITLGLANARIVVIEGDLVKAPNGLGMLLDEDRILTRASSLEELKTNLWFQFSLRVCYLCFVAA